MAARLADLSHAQLVEIAAAGCEASTQVKNRADALLAAHKPLAQWAVEGVLLSSDLVPHLLAPLQLEDGAAAAVCSRWAEGWKATSEGRRRLRKVALDFPHEDLLGPRSLDMAVVPGGDELVVRSGTTVRILGRDMSTSTSFELSSYYGDVVASEEFIYANEDSNEVRCLTHDGTEVAEYEEQDKCITSQLQRANVTHGDRACANYFISDDGSMTLGDFELATVDGIPALNAYGHRVLERTDGAAGDDKLNRCSCDWRGQTGPRTNG